jgi:hypothetical protein
MRTFETVAMALESETQDVDVEFIDIERGSEPDDEFDMEEGGSDKRRPHDA